VVVGQGETLYNMKHYDCIWAFLFLYSITKLSSIGATKVNAKNLHNKLKFEYSNIIKVPTTFIIESGVSKNFYNGYLNFENNDPWLYL